MPKYQYHIFSCINERSSDDPRGSCTARGGKELQELFKKEIHDRRLNKKVRANKAGCLNECANGPAVVVYPEGVWYSVHTKEDVIEIIEKHFGKGEIVKRLIIED